MTIPVHYEKTEQLDAETTTIHKIIHGTYNAISLSLDIPQFNKTLKCA